MLNSKIATTHPNFSAFVIELMEEFQFEPGDHVAVAMSGSFPGANIALLSACKALNIHPIIISSVGSSSWGANNPELSWPAMEMYLYTNKQIDVKSIAYTKLHPSTCTYYLNLFVYTQQVYQKNPDSCS